MTTLLRAETEGKALSPQLQAVSEEAQVGMEQARKRCETLLQMRRKQNEEEEKAKAPLLNFPRAKRSSCAQWNKDKGTANAEKQHDVLANVCLTIFAIC